MPVPQGAARPTEARKPPAQAVLQALSDPAFDFRTVAGIAKEINLSSAEVLSTLNSLGTKVRISNVTDANGNLLYTLSSRRKKLQERKAEFRAFLAVSPSAGRG